MSSMGVCLYVRETMRLRTFYHSLRTNSPRGAFKDISPYSFLNVNIDNVDVAMPNQTNVIGKDTSGAHFTFASAHACVMPESADFAKKRPSVEFLRCQDVFPTREELFAHFRVDLDCPDVSSYTSLLLGAIWHYRERLSCSDGKAQLSLRHL